MQEPVIRIRPDPCGEASRKGAAPLQLGGQRNHRRALGALPRRQRHFGHSEQADQRNQLFVLKRRRPGRPVNRAAGSAIAGENGEIRDLGGIETVSRHIQAGRRADQSLNDRRRQGGGSNDWIP